MGDTGTHIHNGKPYELKRADIAFASGTTQDLVAIVATKSIAVVGCMVNSATTTTIQFLSDAGNIGPVFNSNAAGWWVNGPGILVQTDVGEKLAATTGAALAGVLWYIEL